MNPLPVHAAQILGAVLLLGYDGLSAETKEFISANLAHWLDDYAFSNDYAIPLDSVDMVVRTFAEIKL